VVASTDGSELAIEATFAKGSSPELGVDRGAAGFVRDVEVEHDGVFRPVERTGRVWWAPECSSKGCRVRHRFLLREAAKSLDDLDLAELWQGAFVGSPSAWFLHPLGAAGDTRYRIHFRPPNGLAFAAGIPRGKEDDWYEGFAADLHDAPNCALGRMPKRTVTVGSSSVDVMIAPGARTFADASIERWVESSAKSIAGYFGKFPLSHALVLVLPRGGDDVGFGRTSGGGGATIVVFVGPSTTESSFEKDWVLVHEMVHLSAPLLNLRHRWLREGLATYIEPIARARLGKLSAKRVWKDLLENLAEGLPKDGDQGLDNTPTWGRTYWGGALFCLMADLAIRERTKNAKSIDDALRGVLSLGGDASVTWTIDRFVTEADKATGTTVLRELYDEWSHKPVDVDLPALFKKLGVSLDEKAKDVIFDDTAPLAEIRRSITSK